MTMFCIQEHQEGKRSICIVFFMFFVFIPAGEDLKEFKFESLLVAIGIHRSSNGPNE